MCLGQRLICEFGTTTVSCQSPQNYVVFVPGVLRTELLGVFLQTSKGFVLEVTGILLVSFYGFILKGKELC